MRRRTLLGATSLAMVGCATQSAVEDGAAPTQGACVLALHIRADEDGFIGLVPHNESRTSALVSSALAIMKENYHFQNGEAYYVRQMKPGNYMWGELVFGGRKAVLFSTSRMTVKPNVVTYAGHIRIAAYRHEATMQVFDREREMRQYMSTNYPRLSSSLPFEKALAQIGLRD